VKFPTEYDALDIVTDELKAKLQPASRRLMEIEKDRMERRKVRKRVKNKASTSQTAAPPDSTPTAEEAVMDIDKKPEEGGDLEDESVYRKKELEELEGLISPDVKADVGASPTGLYELVGTCQPPHSFSAPTYSIRVPYDEWIAIITHKGAAADAGHYIGFVKKSVFHPKAGQASGSGQKTIDDDDDDWYKFDDEKVSIFPASKLATLDGGGPCLPSI
jgi:ubiquitin carboxyl-terminal hydrolase 14